MSKIQVRPLDVDKWHGKKGKESFTGTFTVTPLVDAATGKYKTGLTEEEETEYGKLLRVDLNPRYNRLKPHEFWDSESAAIRLENRTNFIDKEDPIGFIHTKTLLASKYIANSMKEWQEGLWPDALFVIVDEDTDSEIEASKLNLINECIIKSAELTDERKSSIILILGGKITKGKSPNYITVELNKLIQKQPKDVLRLINSDKKALATEAMVLEALQRDILQKAGHRVMYMDSVIGEDVFSAAEYLEKKENQELKIRILNSLK